MVTELVQWKSQDLGSQGSDCRVPSAEFHMLLLPHRLVPFYSAFLSKKWFLFCYFFPLESKHKIFEILSVMGALRFQLLKKSDTLIFTSLGVFPPSCCSTENKCSHFCHFQMLCILITIWNGMGIHSCSSALPTHTYMRHRLPPALCLCIALGLMAYDLPNRILQKGVWLTWLHIGFVPWGLGAFGISGKKCGWGCGLGD